MLPRKFWQDSRLRYAMIAGILIASSLILIRWAGLFQSARLYFNDVYFVPAPVSDNIVIIALDDESLERYGRTPSEWSRDVYVDMIDNLIAANPRVLAIDLLFNEVEAEDEQFADALSRLRQNDARTRIVLAIAGINNISLQANPPDVPTFAFSSTPALSEVIAAEADYQGYTNTLPDIDGVVRRQTSLINSNDAIGYSFSIATYLGFLRIPAVAAGQLIVPDNNTLFITPEREVPVDAFGFWQLYYYAPPSSPQHSAFPVVSFVDVVDGNVDAEIFDDKIVLVGLINTTGLLDQYLVPSSENGVLMAGVEIQAHAIESLIQDTFVQSVSALHQVIIIVSTVFIASLLYAYPRWYFKAVLLIIFAVLWFIVASVIFSAYFVAISLFDTQLALIVPFIAALGIDITVERRERQQKEFLLNSVQHIAEQRLHMAQAAQYILDDIQRIVPGYKSKLYFHQGEQVEGFILFEQEADIVRNAGKHQVVAKSYDDLIQLHASPEFASYPIRWQQQNHGLLIITLSQKQSVSRDNHLLIEQLMSQLAPHISNLLLHNELEKQKTLLDAVIAESPASIAIVDDAGCIIQHNDELVALLAKTGGNLQGSSLSILFFSVTENQDLLSEIEAGFRQQSVFHIDEIKIGEKVVSLDAAPLKNYGVWAVIVGDITGLVELSELKTQMLRIAAHDLKNPLTRIMGFSELLEMQLTLNERHSRYLNIIHDSSLEMRQIITDILDLERLRATKVNLKPIEINRVIREVCSSHQPDAIQKKQEFDIQLPDTSLYINADLGQISQAFSNLIGNAIKYTPDEGHVIVRLEQKDKNMYFEVKDNGYGIPAEAQEKLFTEFFRAKTRATSHIQGTGLGLSLVKNVIESHGGEIAFTSEENVGSTFYFSLPVLEMEGNDDLV